MAVWVQLVTVSFGVAAVLGAVVGLWKLGARLVHGARRVSQFMDDWFGESPRPGLPEGRPGVLARLDAIEELGRTTAARVDAQEQRLAAVEGQVAAVEAQLRPNGGTSFHDKMLEVAERSGSRVEGGGLGFSVERALEG